MYNLQFKRTSLNHFFFTISTFFSLSLLLLINPTQAAPAPIHAEHESQIPQTHFVYFQLQHGDEDLGTIKIALFGTIVPKTVENFYTIATTPYKEDVLIGSADSEDKQKVKPHYTNTIFHRIIKDFMIQGGDFENGNGSGGKSIYGGSNFADENFQIRHDVLGRLSMANAGPDTNGSQFFITTAITNWLDGKHVVFGQVVEGLEIILEKVQTVDVAAGSNKPLKDVKIVKSWGERNKEVTPQQVKDFEEILQDEKFQDRMGNDVTGAKHETFVLIGLICLIGIYLAVKLFKGSRLSLGARYASLRE